MEKTVSANALYLTVFWLRLADISKKTVRNTVNPYPATEITTAQRLTNSLFSSISYDI
jgi:hypothetical protein